MHSFIRIDSLKLCTLIFLFTFLNVAYSGENLIAVYGGAGSANSIGESSLNLGLVRLPGSDNVLWGADISKEGTKLDSTYGQTNQQSSATSYNLIVGKNLMFLESSRIDVALILGARETSESCPPSYLGYRCYADSKPDTKYELNSGLVLFWTQSKLLLGIRATTASQQLLIGVTF